MNRLNDDRSLPDSGGDPFHGARANVTDREDPGQAGLKEGARRRGTGVVSCQNETTFVQPHGVFDPSRARVGTDLMMKSPPADRSTTRPPPSRILMVRRRLSPESSTSWERVSILMLVARRRRFAAFAAVRCASIGKRAKHVVGQCPRHRRG